MLLRLKCPASLGKLGLRCASGKSSLQPYEDFKKTMKETKQQYPGLFPDQKTDFENQQKLIDVTWEPSTLEANCETYNASYQNLWDNYGLDKFEWGGYERAPRHLKSVFKNLDYEYIVTMKPAPQKLPAEDWAHMDRKMALGQGMLDEFSELDPILEDDMYNLDSRKDAKINLNFAARDKVRAQLREWINRIHSADDSNRTLSGLPFDDVMMNTVFMEVRHDLMSDGFWQKPDVQKDAIAAEVITETWDRMYDRVVQYTQPDRTREEFDDLKKVIREMFHPKDMEHYKFNRFSKHLFLQAYWKGGAKHVEEVDRQVNQLRVIMNEMPQDILELWKAAMVNKPTAPLTGEIGQFVKALDTAFLPKIISQIRTQYHEAQLIKSGYKVMSEVLEEDHKLRMTWYKRELADLPDLEQSKAKLRSEVPNFADKVDDVIFRQTESAKETAIHQANHEITMDVPLPSFEEMARLIVREHLWVPKGSTCERAQKVDAFVENLLNACKSENIDIVSLDAEAKSLLPTETISEHNPIDDKQYLKSYINYINVQRQNTQHWMFKDFFAQPAGGREGLNTKRAALMSFVDGFDDTIILLLKHMIECKMTRLEHTLDNYNGIVKRFRGEVYGTITSATPMTESQFEQLQTALQEQNPGKTFILNSNVDPSLIAGFVVKCGTQKLDYSLASQTNALRKNLAK